MAAALGAHTNPETVGLFALAIVRLKRSFHGLLSPANIGRVTISQDLGRVKPRLLRVMLAYYDGPLAAPTTTPPTNAWW